MKKPVKNQIRLFVPGRVCLLGEHADWAGQYGRHTGYCLVIGTDQGIHATATAADELFVETPLPTPDGRPSGRHRRIRCRLDREDLLSAATDSSEFFRHCAGVAHEVIKHYDVGGIELAIEKMDLPLKKGVSSSAAVCITVARAFDAVYGLNLFPHELMDLAYRGERLTGSQCGRMDQACIFGKTPVLLSFTGPDDVHIEPIFPEGQIEMFFVDLAGDKDTVKILADLQYAYADNDDLRAALGEDNETFVRRGCRAMVQGDAAELGKVMTEAQKNFDAKIAPACPEQLASPLLHNVLALESIAEHIHGGKGVGSQGDGTAQLVSRSSDDRDEAMKKIAAAFPDMRCFPLTIHPHLPHR
ncbi:MAG: GHMP kinase [Phycisphaerae bacterium]|nr:GHMP kinase [Phycisphaerae bacterium]